MKTIVVVLFAFCALVCARPEPKEELFDIIPVLEREEIRDELGQYSLKYVSGDGTTVSEQGTLKLNAEGDGHVLVKQGFISYQAHDGTPITLEYIADENGFQPRGSHVPVPPLIPAVRAKLGVAPTL